MSALSFVTHPWSLVAIQNLIFGAAASAKPGSALRYGSVVVVAAIAVYFHMTVHNRMDNRMWKTLPGGITIGTVLYAIEKLLISRWSTAVGGPDPSRGSSDLHGSAMSKKTDKPYPKEPAKSSFWFTLDILLSPRNVGTPWQVKNVPRFSSTDPSYVPSRQAFLFRSLAVIVPCFLLHDLSSAQPPPPAYLVTADKQPFFSRLNDVSSEEVIFRVLCSIGFWANAAAYLILYPTLAAFIAVASGISEPAAWAPNFDWLSTAYSVRQFWGVFWHQNLRAMLEGISNAVTFSLLRFSRGTILARYSNIAISFLLSGLLHVASDHALLGAVHESGALRLFLTQAFGIMLEDAFQATYYSITGKSRPSKAPLQHKIIGYIWLALFLGWSTPVWSYPQIRAMRPGRDYVFPFTIFGETPRKL